jgi:Ran GTPase-activating protein (RanGAP) involved in mRNA processing and transport
MSSNRRRKSLSIFRPTVSPLSPIHDAHGPNSAPPAADARKKKLRGSHLFSSSPSNSSSGLGSDADAAESSSQPHLRPRTLQKVNRPSSIFGSFRSFHSLHDDDETLLRTTSGHTGTVPEEGSTKLDVEQMTVLHHSDVQTAGSMFRKRNQYLVLTNSHLLRFKSQSKAAEVFADIPSSIGRSNSIRHFRMNSSESGPDTSYYADVHTTIALRNVVAAYKLDDGRPYFTIELAHYDEATNHASTMALLLNDPRESEIWLTSIRAAIIKSRLIDPMPFGNRAIEHAARALECDSDYDPNHFRIFTVVQRATKSGARSSSDDLGKLMSSIFYFVISYHKVHLVPLPKSTKPGSSASLSEMNGASHPILTLSAISVKPDDDAFQIGFRVPLQPSYTLYLASASANDIALCLRQAAEFLRPLWLEQPFSWSVPENLEEALLPIPESEAEDYDCLERTLIAYCVAYGVDPSNIRYTINENCPDGPEFQLLDPSNPRRQRYGPLELLAILRALRYNESFGAICFRSVKLDALHGLHDRGGSEHFQWSTRSGRPISLPRLDQTPLIVQELQCLTLKCQQLRRYDFSDCLSRKPKDIQASKDPGTGICEAVFPLCLLHLSKVDWISLNGLALSEIDIEYLYAAACKRSSHFRSLELGRCGLESETLRISLEGLAHQGSTLEALVISGNPAKLNLDFLTKNLNQLSMIKHLDISRLQVDCSLDPLIDTDVLLRWELESLVVSGNTLNPHSIEAIAAYLAMEESNTLQELRMEQCQLHGDDVATLLEAMMTGRPTRDLHFVVNENRLEKRHSDMAEAIAHSVTPRSMTMQMLEYSNERNFREMLSAVGENRSLKYLDISRASLPYDATHQTIEEFRRMFENNSTLEDLNISGEQAHLEAVTLGRGLPEALRGLETNNTLKILRVANQALGLPGASALASILENNRTLLELHCEDNEVSLQAFTTIVNAARKNTTILYVPLMDHDRAWSRSKVDREVSTLMRTAPPKSPTTTKSGVRKSLKATRTFSGRSTEKSTVAAGYSEQDVQAAVESLDQTWDSEVARLQEYLDRNRTLARGLSSVDELPTPEGSRPPTAGKLASALQHAAMDRTPTLELNRQLQATSFDDLYALGAPKESPGALAGVGSNESEGQGGESDGRSTESEDDGLIMSTPKR